MRIGEIYAFAKAPKHPLDLNEQKGLAYEMGTFVNSKGIPVNITFTTYNDGFVVDTLSSTDDCNEFLEQLTAWMSQEYKFTDASLLGIRKAYRSQIDVELEVSLKILNPHLSGLLTMIEDRVKAFDGKPKHYEIGALNCWTEDYGKPTAPAAFRLERKIGSSFDSNRYFSEGPFQTLEHIDVIKGFEQLLTS